MSKTQEYLEQLGGVVDELCDFYRSIADTSFLANTSWTARDVLVHIVFWHESFARNVRDLANSVKPKPLKGTYAVLAQRSLEESRDDSVEDLLARLSSAQNTIGESIFNRSVELIPYKVGSRSYAPAEHLAVVSDHLRVHLKKLRTAAAAGDHFVNPPTYSSNPK